MTEMVVESAGLRSQSEDLWQPFEVAPRDGTVILVNEGDHSTAVKWQAHEPDIATVAGAQGYWTYCDALLADVCPAGPTTPFAWMADPAADSGASAIRALIAERDSLLKTLLRIARRDVPPAEPFTGRLCGHGRSVEEDCNLCTASYAKDAAGKLKR